MGTDSKRQRRAAAKRRSLRRRLAVARRWARRVVLPAQRVEWDIKIEAPHDINIGWLMDRIEREIEKSARGESWGCYRRTNVTLWEENTVRSWLDEDTLTEYDWIVTEKTHDTLKIFLIGPTLKGFTEGGWFCSLSGRFNYEVRSRKVVKDWGEPFHIQQL